MTVIDGLIDRTTQQRSLIEAVRSFARYRELVRNLVLKDLKLKYRGSVLGFLWSLINPIAMVTVYSIAFTFILRSRTEHFVFFLLLGLVPWGYFANTATMATGAIVDNAGLMRSVAFPRAILPVAVVLFNLVQFLLTFAVLLPLVLVIFRIAPTVHMLLFPVFVTLQSVFCLGIALLLAAGTAFFRDIRHILELGLLILFWLTPIVYPHTMVPVDVQALLLATPLSPFIVAYQQIFYAAAWPDARIWVLTTAYALGALALGVWLFHRVEDRLMERL